jgi:hypothetical protein
MQPQTMRKRRWFWAWQDYKEEAWLESMSREGWHLQEVGLLSYTFERGEPREWVYRLDFRPSRKASDYIEFVQGAGWQYIGKMSSWLYFRLPAEAGTPAELYTDSEGKVAKYQRIMGILVVTSPAPVYWVAVLSKLDRYPPWVAVPLVAVFLSFTGLYTFSMINLARRIKQLKRA